MDSDSLREDSKEEFVKGIDENQQLIDGRTQLFKFYIPHRGFNFYEDLSFLKCNLFFLSNLK